MSIFSRSAFDKLLDEATNSYCLEIDWNLVLKLCDLIRQKDTSSKHALTSITKKITSSNQHTALYGLCVLESCVKNCGSRIQDEISTKQYMEQFREFIEKCPHENVKIKALDLLQSWAYAFRNNQNYRAVIDTANIMKHEGHKFPAFKESDAMFKAEIAPDWKREGRCHRCRAKFTMVLRQHHCRACGESFCDDCSSHTMTIPKYGFEKEVRVCIACFEKSKSNSPYIGNEFNHNHVSLLQKGKRRSHKSRRSSPSWSKTMPKSTNTNSKQEELPSEYLSSPLAQQSQAPAKKTEEELKEEEELQLALALSQSEAELKNQGSTYRPVTRSKSFSPPVSQKVNQYENEDPELARYLNRSYWDNRANSTDRSTLEHEDKQRVTNATAMTHQIYHDALKEKSGGLATDETNGVESEAEIEEFVNALRSQVEIFVNRMKSNSSRGRSISNDTSVQTLFLNITAMHSKLLKHIQEQDDLRVKYEGLQDKLTQVKDARAALNALREEHRERLRRDAEIAERQRQLQMAQKLQIMRQQKQEYLQYQRQLALQRIHDQERELHMRQEQQKQQYRLGGPYLPGPHMVPSQGGMSAFEPVNTMGMNMSNLPPVAVSAGQYVPSSYPTPYMQGQAVTSVASPPQPQMVAAPQTSMMMGQPQMPPTNSYVPGHQNAPLGPGPQPPPAAQYAVNHQPQPQPSLQHSQAAAVDHMKLAAQQTQPVHVDAQQPQMMPAGAPVHMEPQSTPPHPHMMGPSPPRGDSHAMGPPTGPAHLATLMQHPGAVRPMMPPSSSPLSSPSSSSEHSIIQHGPQPMPSAPSASSTPQLEDKEEVAELISFD